jgi:hypothetical protein
MEFSLTSGTAKNGGNGPWWWWTGGYLGGVGDEGAEFEDAVVEHLAPLPLRRKAPALVPQLHLAPFRP